MTTSVYINMHARRHRYIRSKRSVPAFPELFSLKPTSVLWLLQIRFCLVANPHLETAESVCRPCVHVCMYIHIYIYIYIWYHVYVHLLITYMHIYI